MSSHQAISPPGLSISLPAEADESSSVQKSSGPDAVDSAAPTPSVLPSRVPDECPKSEQILLSQSEPPTLPSEEASTELNSSLLPNFRLGSEEGDISVSLPSAVPLGTGTSSPSISVTESFQSTGTVSDLVGNGGRRSSGEPSSLSRQNSDELPLSLQSWYSEPGEIAPKPSCCSGRSPSKTATSPLKPKRASEEKENETPKECVQTKTTTVVGDEVTTQRVKMRIQSLDRAEVTSLRVDNGPRPTRRSTPANHTLPHHEEGTECIRCSRRSKSGSATPAHPSRTPRRQIASPRSASKELKKPIKSILKSESRGSSGSDKQLSSMDSLGSGPGNNRLMTRSEGGARAKFDFRNSSQTLTSQDDKLAARLKSVEKYATLRLKKSRVSPLVESEDRKNVGKFGRVGSPGPVVDLMSKSLSFLEKSTPQARHVSHSAGAGDTPLQRQGSIRVRKPSPGWEPSATRSSLLRLQKMQEAKAKTAGICFQPSQTGSAHPSSGDSSLGYVATPIRPSPKEPRNLGSKIFSKISSAFNQTASSSQKRVRQDKWVQTEGDAQGPCQQLDTSELNAGSPAPGFRKQLSPKPDVTDSDYVANLEKEVNNLETLFLRSKNKYAKVVEEKKAQARTIEELQLQLSTVQTENKQIVHFLEDEKATLSETLLETEASVSALHKALESQKEEAKGRLSGLVRQSEQLKQEALTSHAILKRMEKEFSLMLNQKEVQLQEAAASLLQMKNTALLMIDKLMTKYDITAEQVNSPRSEETCNGSDPLTTDIPRYVTLIKLLTNAYALTDLSGETVPSSNGDSLPSTPSVRAEDVAAKKPSPTSGTDAESKGSLASLKQAIQDRDEAERLERACSLSPLPVEREGQTPISQDIKDLQKELHKLFNVIRALVEERNERDASVISTLREVMKRTEAIQPVDIKKMEALKERIRRNLIACEERQALHSDSSRLDQGQSEESA